MREQVSTDPDVLKAYDDEIARGQPPEVAFVWAADAAARKEFRLAPCRGKGEISFGAGDRRLFVSPDFGTQVNYSKMRHLGESHAMAEMLATRSFPAVRGLDSDFNKGRCNGNQFEKTPGLGDYYRKLAEDAGVSTTGRTYLHGLAEFPGDPAAWVGDTNDVLRVAREKGFRVQGAVEYTPPPPANGPAADVPIAPEIVEEQVQNYMDLDPGERREDVRERVTQALTGAVDLNNPVPGRGE